MANARTELSSIASSLEMLNQRIAEIAERESDNGDSDLATELFETERSLMAGHRRLMRAVGRS